jgi:hypothetical protein
MGGDGMQIQIDKRNPNIVFTGFSLEIIRIDRATNKRVRFAKAEKMKKTIPFQLANTYFMCLTIKIFCIWDQFFYRSMNQGKRTAISPDLTNGTKEGNVALEPLPQ